MITKYDSICAICGKPKEHTHHLLYGNGTRPLADADKITIPLCEKCHSELHTQNGMAAEMSRIIGQLEWEKNYILTTCKANGMEEIAREQFRKRYGRSYL